MTRATTAERAQMASGGDTVQRFIAVGTRESIFSDVVTAVVTDPDTGSIIALDHAVSWAAAGVQPGMTVDIGTTAGGRDVGSVRLRYYNSTNTHMTVAETAPAELPILVGHHITVRMEYRPWRIPKRIVTIRDGDGNITDVVEYLDYDVEYPAGTYPHDPKANITAGRDDDGNWLMPRLAAWEDTPGCGYRTVTLSSLASVCHNPGLSITGQVWGWGSGTLAGGNYTDAEITLRLNVGFQYVYLLVSDGYRSDTMRLPFWTFGGDYQPLTNFTVAGDETEAGREMAFDFTGNANEADVIALPEGALILYFESPEWANSSAYPANYRGQCMGWICEDTPLLKLADSRYSFKIAGAQRWWASYRATSLTIIDPEGTPARYSEMEHITVNRVLDFALRAYSTVRSLVSIFYADVATEVEIMTLPLGNTWQQMTQLAPTAKMTMPRCDSLGNLYLRRHYSYLTDAERLARTPALALTPADWKDEDGLELPTSFINPVGLVNANGELWDNDQRVLCAALAPGKRDSYGLNTAKLPDQFLDQPTPQADLATLAGYHFWHENNPRPNVTLKLLGNLDVVEPAWGEPVSITWTGETVRGTVLNAALFLVNRVSTQHGAALEDEPKVITWTLEQVTGGAKGQADDTRQYEGVDQPIDNPIRDLLNAGTDRIAAATVGGHLIRTANFTAVEPTWTDFDLPALHEDIWEGSVCDVLQSPFSLLVALYITTARIYRVSNIHAVPDVASVFTFRKPVGDVWFRQIQYERGQEGFAVVVSAYDDGIWVTRTLDDGLTWASEIRVGVEYDARYWYVGVEINPHNGKTYLTAHNGTAFVLYESSDLAASFSESSDYHLESGSGAAAMHLLIPWADPGVLYSTHDVVGSNPESAYILKSTASGQSSLSLPTPTGPVYSRRGLKAADSDASHLLLAANRFGGFGQPQGSLLRSLDAGETWDTILAEPLGDIYRGCAIGGDEIASYVWGYTGDSGYGYGDGGIWYAEPFSTFEAGDLQPKGGPGMPVGTHILNIFGLP
jgi:hypothetical protein